MTTVTRESGEKAGHEVVVEHTFDAPTELVWKAWTEPEHFMRWFGPQSFTIPTCEIDFRLDGKYLCCMRDPAGKDYWLAGEYSEIVPMQRIVCTQGMADEHGNVMSESESGMGESVLTLVFEDVGGKTKLTLTQTGFPANEAAEMAGMGWNQAFEKLAATLA